MRRVEIWLRANPVKTWLAVLMLLTAGAATLAGVGGVVGIITYAILFLLAIQIGGAYLRGGKR